jgi:hypothetical protein
MKHVVGLLVVALLFYSVSAFAATPQDCYTWMGWTPSFKLGYVVGFMEASDAAGAVGMAGCMNMLNYLDFTKVSGEKWKDMCLNDKAYDFDGIPMNSSSMARMPSTAITRTKTRRLPSLCSISEIGSKERVSRS